LTESKRNLTEAFQRQGPDENAVATRPKPIHQLTTAQFKRLFRDEEACRKYLVARRWPNGVRCPRCGNSAVYHLSREWYWQCEKCAPDGYRFSHIAGTLFENTNKPLRDWFRVIHLMLKKDMSTHEIHWLMGFGSYKTAWYMCHRVRAALADGSLQKLAGVVVVDETFIVGEAKRSQARDVARELLKRADAIVQHAQRLDEAETIKIEASRAIADEWTRMRELARELRLYLPSRQDFFSSKDAVLQRDAIAKELGERVP